MLVLQLFNLISKHRWKSEYTNQTKSACFFFDEWLVKVDWMVVCPLQTSWAVN